MKARRGRQTVLALISLGLCATAAWWMQSAPPMPLAATVLAAEPGKLHWYRGNLHTHSLWSDGDDFPESIALWYREHGYHFLGFSDHNILHVGEKWVEVSPKRHGPAAVEKLKSQFPADWLRFRMRGEKREVQLRNWEEFAPRINQPGKFLLIPGEEISDHFGKLPLHLNALNTMELIVPRSGESVEEVLQNNVDAVIALRERTGRPMLVHINHPNFGFAITAEELARIRGEKFFEVYNGHPITHNHGDDLHASTERVWDILLTQRIAELHLPLMYGLANDDSHNYHGDTEHRRASSGRGWVMVLADALTPASLISALEAGQFYASSGVRLKEVRSTAEAVEVEIDADTDVRYEIEFIGTRKGYDPASTPVLDKNGSPKRATRHYSDDIGRVLRHIKGTRGRYEFQGDELYVRARILSSRKHPNPSDPGDLECAWVQPVLGPAAPK